jgi:hypothetical protein
LRTPLNTQTQLIVPELKDAETISYPAISLPSSSKQKAPLKSLSNPSQALAHLEKHNAKLASLPADKRISSLLTAFFNVPSWSATLPPLARSSALAHLSRSSISFRLSAGRLASPGGHVEEGRQEAGEEEVEVWKGVVRRILGTLPCFDLTHPQGRSESGTWKRFFSLTPIFLFFRASLRLAMLSFRFLAAAACDFSRSRFRSALGGE